jgi:hypothetical protein
MFAILPTPAPVSMSMLCAGTQERMMQPYQTWFTNQKSYQLPDGTLVQALWIESLESPEGNADYWLLAIDEPSGEECKQWRVRADGVLIEEYLVWVAAGPQYPAGMRLLDARHHVTSLTIADVHCVRRLRSAMRYIVENEPPGVPTAN